MKKQDFQDYVKSILINHSISLDNDEGTTEFEQLGDAQALADSVFHGGESHLTINEDGEQLGGISFNVEDNTDIEYREIKLINNSPNVEYLVPQNIEVVPNPAHTTQATTEDMFGNE